MQTISGTAASGRTVPVIVAAPPQPLGVWAAWRAARRNLLEIVPQAAYREPILQSAVRGRWRMLMEPSAVEHVLKTRARDYPRSDVTRRLLRPTSGESLFTADWDDWRWQHRAAAPMFQPRNLLRLAPAMTASAAAASGRIEAALGAGPATVDVYEEMVAATLDVILDAVLSGGGRLDRAEVARGVTRFIETVARVSLLDVLGAPDWIPRPGRLFSRAPRQLDRMVDAVIEDRLARRAQEAPPETADFLDMLMDASDPEGGRGFSRVEVRNNLLVFIAAGHETTALALSWALYLLALDPAAQDRARAEAEGALQGRAAEGADVARLGYVRQVLDEALRLYPPGGFMARTAKAEHDMLGGPVRPGETIMIPVYAMHRHRALWSDPDAFDPDRFAPGAGPRHRFAYLPFGAGPRICIGMGFALMEATIILATLVSRFRFRLPPGYAPRPRMILTLRPEGGLPLIIERAKG
jgi:cytochrome P450